MGKRLFWFSVGVSLTIFVVVKGREYYERFTPKGVADTLEKTGAAVATRLGDFFETLDEAMAEREGQLHEALGLVE
ncbi:MAG: hypothetical protein WAL91_01975 [Propionicimonas sp.]